MAKQREDITGEEFGRLTALRFDETKDSRRSYWICQCSCGNIKSVRLNSLRSGHTTSCGCWHKEYERASYKHGLTGEPEYAIWVAMNGRCSNFFNPIYRRYGGRGIKVCDRWKSEDGFTNFHTDMGSRPSDEYSLERIDNDGNFEPGNCKWATKIEQARNNSRKHLITFEDKTKPSITVTLEIPAGNDWEVYIKSLLSDIQF